MGWSWRWRKHASTPPRRIGVSAIADYAADPRAFCRRRGGVRNREAARHGQWVHGERTGLPAGTVIVLLLLTYGAAAWFFGFGEVNRVLADGFTRSLGSVMDWAGPIIAGIIGS